MPDKDISRLNKILSLIIDEIGSTKKIAGLQAIESEVKEEWHALSDIEAAYVEKVLGHTRGNKQAAARILGIDRKTLDRAIRRHNITLPELVALLIGPFGFLMSQSVSLLL